MNRYYRSYCRQVSQVMFLRPYFPRSVLDDAELVSVYQAAQSNDLDILRQTAAELFPERFPEDHSPEEQALGEGHGDCIAMVHLY